MQNQETDNRAEVTIKLTEEQREQVKRGTGRLITELKVGVVEERANPITTSHLEVVFD